MDIARVGRHFFFTHRVAKKLFDRTALERLQAVIADGETRHRGEVRLIVESALPLRKVMRGMNPRHRALDLFGTYRVWDTEHNNGVLLYLNVADRCVEIIADRAAARAVDDATWRAIAEQATRSFTAGDFEAGTSAAITGLHDVLTRAFPADGPARHELDDAPVLR